jgi:FHS family Na+ dependent glucose MFS transporter 1
MVASLLGVYVGSEVAFGGYVLTYSHLRLGFEEAQGQFVTAVYWGALAGGRFFAIFLSMRVSPRNVLWFDLIGCVLSSMLILVWSSSPLALWLGSALFGFSMASIFPTVLSLAESFTPISGKVASVFIIGASTGELSLPALVGNLIESNGPETFPWAIVVFSVVSLGMLPAVLVVGHRLQRHQLHAKSTADLACEFTPEESDVSSMLEHVGTTSELDPS